MIFKVRTLVVLDVWVSCLTEGKDGHAEGSGKLTAGYGARQDAAKNGGRIGPEFTFGIMRRAYA
jgi:alpha-galactosidase